jgi:hypothetical protein
VSIRQLVLIVTVLVGVATAFILMSHVWQPLLLLPFAWLWLVGSNVALGIFRFKRFVARAIATAPHFSVQPLPLVHSLPK